MISWTVGAAFLKETRKVWRKIWSKSKSRSNNWRLLSLKARGISIASFRRNKKKRKMHIRSFKQNLVSCTLFGKATSIESKVWKKRSMESRQSIPQNWKVQIKLCSLKRQRNFVQSKHRNWKLEAVDLRPQWLVVKIRSEGIQVASW